MFLTKTTDTSVPFTGQANHTYRFFTVATDNVGHSEAAPLLPDAQVTIITVSWTNSREPRDVNGDGSVAPVDVVQLINELNESKVSLLGGKLPEIGQKTPPPYFDVNRDGFISPVDVVIVINFLNAPESGEGETAGSYVVWFAVAGSRGEAALEPHRTTASAVRTEMHFSHEPRQVVVSSSSAVLRAVLRATDLEPFRTDALERPGRRVLRLR